MKQSLTLLAALLAPLVIVAQWNALVTGTTSDLLTVEAVSADTVFAAGNNIFIKSTDGGQNWTSIPFVNASNQPINGLVINDLHFFDGKTGIAAGSQASTIRVVLRTTDGGAHWTVLHSTNAENGWPGGFYRVFFLDNQTGWCAGTSGRILKTVNGGQSWTSLPSQSGYTFLRNVQFVDAQTGYVSAVIDFGSSQLGSFLKTTDGGQSWSTITQGGSFQEFLWVTPDLGYLASDTYLYRIGNDIFNWAYIPMADEAVVKRMMFFSGTTGYALTANSVRKTQYSGDFWETVTLPVTSNQELQDFDWLPDGVTGYAVGKNGVAFKTGNGGGQLQPMAFFITEPQIGFCKDSVISLFNTAPESVFESKWLVDGQLYSSEHEPEIVFSDYNTTHTIVLEISNGIVSDTFSRTITTEPSLDFNLGQLQWISPPSACGGAVLNFKVANPVQNLFYQFYVNDILFYQQLAYDDDSIVVTTPSLYDTVVLRVETTNYNLCASLTKSDTLIANVTPLPDKNLSWEVPNPQVCAYSGAQIVIHNSEPDVTYKLLGAFTDEPPVQGNGGDLIFTSPPLILTGFYQIEARNVLDCPVVLDQSVYIEVDNFFNLVDTLHLYGMAGQPIPVANSTGGLSSVTWNFGAMADPPVSTVFEPVVIYPGPGLFPYSYQYQSQGACTGLITGDFEIFEPAPDLPGAFCAKQPLAGLDWEYYNSGHHVLDVHADANGNIVVTGARRQEVFWWTTMNLFLRKYNASGQLLWAKETDPDQPLQGIYYRSSYGTSVATDLEGNIYLAGSYVADNAVILGENFDMPNSTIYSSPQGMLFKLSPDGEVIWKIQFNIPADYEIAVPASLLYSATDNRLHLTLHGNTWQAVLPDGSTVANGTPFAKAWYISFDTSGNFVTDKQLGEVYAQQLLGAWYPATGTIFTNLATFLSPRIKEAADGKLIFSGGFSGAGYVTFDNFEAAALNTDGAIQSNHFIAVLDRNSGAWLNAYSSHGVGGFFAGPVPYDQVLPAWEVDPDGSVYLGFGLNSPYFDEQSELQLTAAIGPSFKEASQNRSYVCKFDPDGNLLWKTRNTNMYFHKFVRDATGNIIALAGYDRVAGFRTPAGQFWGQAAIGEKDVLLAKIGAGGEIAGLHTFGSAQNDQPVGMARSNNYRIAVLLAPNLDHFFNANPSQPYELHTYASQSDCPPVATQEPGVLKNVVVAPNPFSETTDIRFPLEQGGDVTVQLFDQTGRLVFEKRRVLLPAEEAVLSIQPHIPAGIYTLRLLTPDGVAATVLVRQ